MKEENPESKNYPFQRGKHLAQSAGVGYVVGAPTGIVSYVLNRQRAVDSVNLGLEVGIDATALSAAMSLSQISHEIAEQHRTDGNRTRERLALVRADIEAAIGTAVPFFTHGMANGLTSGRSIGWTALETGLGAVVGAAVSHNSYRDRVRPYPELVIPDGSSVFRYSDVIEQREGIKYPPVFVAHSIKDLQEFREVNKETIIKWAGYRKIPERPSTVERLINSSTFKDAPRLATAVFVLPDLQHYPAYDPTKEELSFGPATLQEQSIAIALSDATTQITTYPCESATQVWPYQTIFEDAIISRDNRMFNKQKWSAWRDTSWKHTVVLVAQFQALSTFPRTPREMGKIYNMDNFVDQYYLLDIITEGRGTPKRVAKSETQPQILPVFQPENI